MAVLDATVPVAVTIDLDTEALIQLASALEDAGHALRDVVVAVSHIEKPVIVMRMTTEDDHDCEG